jgi:serine/threonine-protein kinase
MSLASGSQLSGYVLEDRIGGGGFSEVFRARDSAGKEVAIKVLLSDLRAEDGALARFDRELEILSELSHPSIVRALMSKVALEPAPHFAMELVRGESLAGRLERGALEQSQALRILSEIASALDCLHQQGVVHRDIKSSNVLLAEDTGRAVLIDFGIARISERLGLTRSCQLLGSLAAMAPEQISGGEITPHTDVYALGALLYHMLTSTPPFGDEEPEIVQHMHRFAKRPAPSRVAHVDPRFDAIVARAMAIDPAQRYPSAGALARAALALFASDHSEVCRRPGLAVLLRAAGDAARLADRVKRLEAEGFSCVLRADHASLLAIPADGEGDLARCEAALAGAVEHSHIAEVQRGEVEVSGAAIVGGPLVALEAWAR